MNCYVCGGRLIWGGDHDVEEEDGDWLIETNLTCPDCGSMVLVHHGNRSGNDGNDEGG